MDLKSQIVEELHKKKRKIIFKNVEYDFGPLEEISTIDLPFITIPFLNGCVYDNSNSKDDALDSLEEFKFLVEGFGVVSEALKVACTSRTREDKIIIHNIKKSFTYHFIDWDDREWLLKLLEYFYILSSEKIYFLKEEAALPDSANKQKRKSSEEKIKSTEAFQIKELKSDLKREGIVKDNDINDNINNNINNNLNSYTTTVKFSRNDLLRRRINPKYTLEEFGDVIAERLKQLKDMPVYEEKQKEKSLEELRKDDEEKDEKHIYKGNTENVG